MTAGQWLLDFFWMNSDTHEAFNKWGGVLMAIIGAVVVAPQAAKHVLNFLVRGSAGTAALALKRLWARLRGRTLDQVTAASPVSWDSHVGKPAVTNFPAWDEAASLAQKVQWLKAHDDHLNDVWQGRFARLEEVDQQTKLKLNQLDTLVRGEIDRLGKQIRKIERDSVQIDATGLPAILFGIILTGVPEELARWDIWGWKMGWLVWFIGAAVAIWALIQSFRTKMWA